MAKNTNTSKTNNKGGNVGIKKTPTTSSNTAAASSSSILTNKKKSESAPSLSQMVEKVDSENIDLTIIQNQYLDKLQSTTESDTINGMDIDSEDDYDDTPEQGYENRYKYRGFNAKIGKIDISTFNKRVGDRIIEVQSDNDSYFVMTLQQWTDNNLTLHYSNFRDDINAITYMTALPQVLLHKDELIRIIIKHLQVPNSMALKAILSVLAALSRDLRSEFYESFLPVLQVLIQLLQIQPNSGKPVLTSEAIEEIFTSICFMFKFLEKYILKDFITLYKIYSQLFTHKKHYIRRFAAEGLAFLVRKIGVESVEPLLEEMFRLAQDDSSYSYADSFSYLLFGTVKGVKGRFHSRTEILLPVIFRLHGGQVTVEIPVHENDASPDGGTWQKRDRRIKPSVDVSAQRGGAAGADGKGGKEAEPGAQPAPLEPSQRILQYRGSMGVT
ncbi:HEAT repeat-containing protein [Cavenderia fasciculata]|uniref:HEAT repeat-containing protein n=1 Tax=Cavenderia fasciculata TaxID=261658 RepID=F4QEJ0_CACFS|nr:HEAT repeat-containing protein [Cavenderia fasciculata]EGG14101.1 HEAT repeat-containing protein [Cavenderia fasciculata]|eukprot:XP_004350809.1 HEAT repeat-containing protein [Cavenderia fasciculata]